MRRSLSRAAFALMMLSAAVAHAQSVDEIVAKNLQTKGGAAKWKSISTVRMSGKVTAQGSPELDLTVYAKRPNYTRQEISLQDNKIVQAFDGTNGWMINPMMGTSVPQPLPANVTQIMRETADFDGLLMNYREKGTNIELVGKEKLADKAVHHLKITTKGGAVHHYFLDVDSGVELKRSQEIEMAQGEKQTLETEMSGYQPVDGVMVPKSIKQLIAGKTIAEMSIDKVEFNSPVEDAMFKMPGK
jgi:outer membrane lipoprotein-sorting protein